MEKHNNNIYEWIQAFHSLHSLHYKYHFGGAKNQYIGEDTGPSLPLLQITVEEQKSIIVFRSGYMPFTPSTADNSVGANTYLGVDAGPTLPTSCEQNKNE
jgi:hypothetical protein